MNSLKRLNSKFRDSLRRGFKLTEDELIKEWTEQRKHKPLWMKSKWQFVGFFLIYIVGFTVVSPLIRGILDESSPYTIVDGFKSAIGSSFILLIMEISSVTHYKRNEKRWLKTQDKEPQA